MLTKNTIHHIVIFQQMRKSEDPLPHPRLQHQSLPLKASPNFLSPPIRHLSETLSLKLPLQKSRKNLIESQEKGVRCSSKAQLHITRPNVTTNSLKSWENSTEMTSPSISAQPNVWSSKSKLPGSTKRSCKRSYITTLTTSFTTPPVQINHM